jgi:hypothetical protein
MIIGIAGKKQSGKDEVAKIIQYLTSYYYTVGEKTYEEARGKILPNGDGYCNFAKYSSPFAIKKFADKLKDIVCLLTGCTREQLEDQDFKNRKLPDCWYSSEDDTYFGSILKSEYTYRDALQLIGTDLFRKQFHDNTWVNATMSEYSEEYSYWVISDVRFPNEVKAIKERGGIIIKLERFDYKSRRSFILEHPNAEVRKLGNKIINKDSYFEFEELAERYGYVPLNLQHESETALDDYKDCYIIKNRSSIDDLLNDVKGILEIEKII